MYPSPTLGMTSYHVVKHPVECDLVAGDDDRTVRLRFTYGTRNQSLPFNEEIELPDWAVVKLAALLNQTLQPPKSKVLKGLDL